ncbi:MAG: DUF2147 domain-containing protein [Rhizobiaceae bacterium]|nr:DUF2147 domain-containing protein [Rhizobiaceae bacterium]
MKTTRTLIITAAALLAGTTIAFAEPIVGNWKTQSGETAKIAKCGGSYCIQLVTGKYSGQRIGKMSGNGGSYNGTITDPADGKEYSGSAKVTGSKMSLKGCALKIFCKTQKWNKL